jgi:MFS transporter, FHS family, glucose/mannose:H+ symporter
MSGTAVAGPIRTGWLSAAAYSGMFGFGIVMALLGAILPLLSRRLGFELGQAGNLFLAMNGAMLVTTFALGPLLDRFGLKPALAIAPLFVAVALVLVANAPSFQVLTLAVVLLGIGGGALNQATNTLVADLHEDARRKSAALNLLGVFFGFGALFVPFTIGSLLGALGLANILYVAVALTLVSTALSVTLTFPSPRQGAGVPFSEVLRLGRQPLVIALAALLFFESGNEFILGGYITSYLTRVLGSTVSTASYLLAGYWAAIMLGRIVLSRISLRVSGHTLVLASALVVAGSVAVLVVSASVAVAAVAVVALGLGIAAIYPAVLGVAGTHFASHSGTVFGILIGVALTGGMTMPWFAGQVAGAHGVAAGLAIPIANALCIFALQLVAGKIARRRKYVE